MREWRQRVIHELFTQLKTSIPASLSSVVYKIPWLISVGFVGRIGANELAAAALATSLCNVTGLSLSLGLSSAVTTLTGQSKGEMERRRKILRKKGKKKTYEAANDEKKLEQNNKRYDSIQKAHSGDENIFFEHLSHSPMTPKTYLYRGIFVQLMFVLPVGLYWISGIESLLISLGQEENIAEMAASYLRILTPGLWSYSMNFTLNSWLQAIEMADVPMYGGLVGLVFHVPMNVFFIYRLEWGYKGAAAATSIFQIIQPLASFCYLFVTKNGKRRVSSNTGADVLVTPIPLSFDMKRAICSYKGICQYLGLALPGIVIISEWWASETAIFLAGRLPFPAVSLATMTIYQSINSSCFMFPVGVSVACATRVSNLLGARDPIGASLASKVSLVYAGLVGLVLASVLYFTPHEFFPSLFTPNINIIREAAKTLPFLSLYVFADGIQYTINGIVKGCGRQCIVMPIVIFAYWIVGLPLGYYMGFRSGNAEFETKTSSGSLHGVTGLVFGMTVGTWTHFVLLAIVVGMGTNWDIEVVKAQDRLKLEDEEKKIPARNFRDDIENQGILSKSEEERIPLAKQVEK